jgi:hypothetical protein
MKNDPRFQAMAKNQKEMEEKIKAGDAPASGKRRIVLNVLRPSFLRCSLIYV